MAEAIVWLGRVNRDQFGDESVVGERRDIPGCVVGLRGQESINGEGVWDGDATTLEVFAPPGAQVSEGELVEFRGQRYTVSHVPFDWSVGRRPANRRHRPRVRFLIERSEA